MSSEFSKESLLQEPVPNPDYRFDFAPKGCLLALANPKEKFDQIFDEEMMNTSELTMEDIEEMYGKSLIDFAQNCSCIILDGYKRANYSGALMVFAWAIGEKRFKVLNQTENLLEVQTSNHHFLFSKEWNF